MKRRIVALLMAALITVSGCGVRSGMEKVEDAKQAKKQVEKQRRELEKNLQENQ
jgi:cell division protein FtsB